MASKNVALPILRKGSGGFYGFTDRYYSSVGRFFSTFGSKTATFPKLNLRHFAKRSTLYLYKAAAKGRAALSKARGGQGQGTGKSTGEAAHLAKQMVGTIPYLHWATGRAANRGPRTQGAAEGNGAVDKP